MHLDLGERGMSNRKTKCTFEEFHLRPCSALEESIEGLANAKGKGLRLYYLTDLTDVSDNSKDRSTALIRSTQHPSGLLLNYCPFCGIELLENFRRKS